jgi:hypothetical protein
MGIYGLQLKKGGDLFSIEWDPKREDYVEQIVLPDDYVFFTNEYICLDKNISLRDFFLLINKHIEYFSVISAFSFLQELVQEALSEPKDLCKEINFLELKRVAYLQGEDCLKEYDGFLLHVEEQEEHLYKTFDFCGVGPEENYGLELLPLSSFITLPLFINEFVEIQKNEKTVFTYNEKFTLCELINGIVEEIAYAGAEEDKNLLREKIQSAVQEAKEGKVNFISFEDLKKEMEGNVNNIIPCKYCGKESRSPHFNKPEKVCFECFKKSREN